jgi:hypothetical protein
MRIGDPRPTSQATIRDRLQLTEILRQRIIELAGGQAPEPQDQQNLPAQDLSDH